MAPDRITNAIDSLITHIVPSDPNDPEDVAQERHDTCFEIVKSIIDSPVSPAISSDVNHASDLIKRKLIQSNPTQALRFSNLYTRLLSLPVLEHKWAILYLLYQLADSPDPSEPLPLSPVKPSAPNYRDAISRDAIKRQGRERTSRASRFEEEQFKEAFQSEGLKKVPQKESKQSSKEGDPQPPESVILRDLPFTLQGLSSTNLPFAKSDLIKLPATLPLPIISLLHTLAEPSLLYRGLDGFCKTPAKGLLGQSLRAAIHGELKSYLSLIATLETQIRRALASLDEEAPREGIGRTGVTLKRCVVWTREATMGLRLMSLIAEESEKNRGGQLVSLIHSFSSSHGDPVVAAFAERLLRSFTRPFYDILRHWIYDGELSDPFQEFFVREQAPDKDQAKAKGAGNVWEDKFEIAADMIPSIITQDFAQKVFLIGKSLNFIRHSCGDAMWVEDYSKAASKELRYGDTATLEAWIDEAYKTTMKRLIDLMANKFHLFKHLQALKNYILLGQGDFIVSCKLMGDSFCC
ncbi:Spindle pole body component alp6 [Fusarium odoratissimum]|uniref:Spindle pole body component alp6 n=1 Tax=Fusarium oxysporum f. sp. cubense (strain race 4) TaxID=2502994 RepID=N1RDJ5_FUSC4|nr:Spindle pole body component alp6 [Fusarium odoratissimum]